MNEPTEIKYPLDENGEPYFAATHIKAVKGLEFDNDEDLLSVIFNLQSEISTIKDDLALKDTTIKNLTTRLATAEQEIIALTPKEVKQ
ncbi:hypothetical protein ASS90_12175 [Staphylococcus saprophyticus]|uniref:hypothetical protein n=1 Tax=Staphylococcus saprophyticus TaxID=29385 RepID=UPI00085357DC|nr:hypothetical protein [Staphylococcus saprophyticus]OEK41447.1 hypothetical protein ASS90_12175 [Staphylococcus saprophyticus]